jgi:hypothetical protein
MNIQFATWNMAYWTHRQSHREAWQYFTEDLHSDVFLFQEARPDFGILEKDNLVWHEADHNGHWGSGVYSPKYKIKEYTLRTNLKGAVTAAEIELYPNSSVIVVSLYGMLENLLNTQYSIPNLHRILSDLTVILEGKDTRDRIVLGGDFNAPPVGQATTREFT